MLRQRTTLKRAPTRRKPPAHQPAVEREPRPMAPLRQAERACTYSGGVSGPAPKGEKAKPGKGAPNAEERRWLDAIVSRGCIACGIDGTLVQGQDGVYEPRRPQVHHILRGGQRMGHLWTLPLCDGHHQQGTGAPGLVARHPYRARFEAKYGTEAELLARLRAEIGWKEPP